MPRRALIEMTLDRMRVRASMKDLAKDGPMVFLLPPGLDALLQAASRS